MRLQKTYAHFKFFFKRLIYLNTQLVYSLIGGEREEMAREREVEEDMERRHLLWEWRRLTAAKRRKMERLHRELNDARKDYEAVSKLTKMLENGELTTDEAKNLLAENAEMRWEFLRKKGVMKDETA